MEQVIMEVSATMEGAGGLGQGKLRVTSERLFERKKMFGGAGDVTSFPLDTIQAAGISGILDEKLKVRAGSTELLRRCMQPVLSPTLSSPRGKQSSSHRFRKRGREIRAPFVRNAGDWRG